MVVNECDSIHGPALDDSIVKDLPQVVVSPGLAGVMEIVVKRNVEERQLHIQALQYTI